MATNLPLDEASLIRLVQAGTPVEAAAATEQLYSRHSSHLLVHLQQKGLTHHEQEDVASETWIRALEKITQFRDKGVGLFPWLRTIADNVALEHFKKYSRESVGWESDIRDDEGTVAIPDPAPPVIEQLSRQEILEVVQQILSEAPSEDYKNLIEAGLLVGLKPEEIKEYYGWSESKLYSTSYRAIRWLRKKLRERYGPEITEG